MSERRSLRTLPMNRKTPAPEPEPEKLLKPKRRKVQPQSDAQKDELARLMAMVRDTPLASYQNIMPERQPDATTPEITQQKAPVEEHQFLYLSDQKYSWMYDDSDTDDDDEKDAFDHNQVSSIASNWLEEDESAKVQGALEKIGPTNAKKEHYRLFTMPCVLPEPRLLDTTVDSPTDISKMTQLKQYAKDGRMRKNLLQMDMLAFWYQQGWACPSNVYQWVAEMVAFESEYMVAKHARDTLFSLWTTLPGEKMPFKAGSACNGCITMDTIKHVFEAYGLDTSSSSVRLLAKNSELMRMHSTNKATDVPVTQLGWFMQLISKSMTLWPQAYSEEDVAYMVRVLVSFGADAMSILTLSDLQDALHASLYVLSTDRWMPFARNISEELGNAYNWELDVIAPIVTTISPWLPRCLYLRRIFAILALAHSMSSNRANGYLSDVQIASATAAATTPDPRIATVASAVASGAILTPDSIPCSPAILSAYSTPTNATPCDTPTPPIVPVVPEAAQIVAPTPSASTFDASTTQQHQQQSNNSAEVEDDGNAAAVESKSTAMVSQDTPALGESTIVRLITVVDQFLAFKLDEIDFHRLIQQITLLDSAISGNMDEIQQIKEEIQHLVSRLKMLGRKLSSASLGSLERTMAGEVVQRLWNRLNYLVHRNGSKLQKDEL